MKMMHESKMDALLKLKNFIDQLEEEIESPDDKLKEGTEEELGEHNIDEDEAEKLASDHLATDPEAYDKDEGEDGEQDLDIAKPKLSLSELGRTGDKPEASITEIKLKKKGKRY